MTPRPPETGPPPPVPMDRAVLVVDRQGVRWTSDPRGPAAMAGLFHGEAAEDAWVTAEGGPCRPGDLPVFRVLADHVPQTAQLLGHRETDGSTRWLLLSVHPVDWHGEAAVSVVVEDAAPLMAQEQRHRRLLAAHAEAQMCSWELDLETGLIETTAGGEALWGLPADGVPRPVDDYLALVPESDAARVRQAVEAARGGAPQELTVRVVLGDGERRWYHVLLGHSDESSAALRGLTRDVTRRHEAEIAAERMEAQLAQAARLESLGQLAGGIAHDVNNLLGAIGIQVELADRATARGEAPTTYLHDIGEAVDRGVDLTRQLLAFSRLDEVNTQYIDVNKVTSQVRDLTRGLLPARIAQRVVPDDDAPPVVLARGQLEQVLMNLVVNARDAMPEGGTLTMATERSVDDETGQQWVQVIVSDTGTGMDAETAARIFDPFFTTKPRGQGTGLGLAVVQGIVAKGGGRLRVDTAPGEGTRITVSLPAAIDAAAPAAPRRPGRGQLVVVVEDDAALRAVIATALDDAGYTTVATDDPTVALATVTTTPVSVVLSDVVMADVSGPELAEQLRAARPGLPVLLMSGFTDGRLTGEKVALRKPFTVAQLVGAVERALATGPG